MMQLTYNIWLSIRFPNVTGVINTAGAWIFSQGEGAFSLSSYGYRSVGNQDTSATCYGMFVFKASNSNSIYKDSSTLQPKSLVSQYLIKY